MIRSIFLSFLLIAAASPFGAQDNPKFTVFDGKGNPSSIAEIIKALDNADVVFLGELHDDAVGHAVQYEIFKQAVDKFTPGRKVTLSLEMFETDVQIVLDEYLKGLISENHFLLSARPWGNYKTDYRPLVELAKEKKLDVIAANAPRRYVNMVSRGGRDALNGLSKDAKKWLAPLPYEEPSEAYSKKFKVLMGSSPEAQMGIDKILSSQSLWDATMAYSIARSLKKNKRSLVIHLNGGFHTENRLGTMEHFLRYRRKAKALVVTIKYADDFNTFDKAKHTDLGDFVILTQPRPKTQAVIREIFERMKKHNELLSSASADVTMTRHNSQLGASDTYSGRLTYLSGDSKGDMAMRVDWTKPQMEHFSLVEGRYLLYRPRLSQAIIGDLKDQNKGRPAAALAFRFMKMSAPQFKADFDVAYMGEETVGQNVRTWHLRLTPKNRTVFKAADVWVDVNGMPIQVTVSEHNGDTTTVHLSHITKNLGVSPSAFRIVMPNSVKLIRL